jgi:glycosyltransferase involved in cell wall biosynthesis
MNIQKLSIVIPAYNEEATIFDVLNKVVELELIGNVAKQVIVVDDCSSDATFSEIKRFQNEFKYPDLIIHQQSVNQGKGAAIHKGIELSSGDYLVMQDADLELNPEDINFLLGPILENKSNVVYGSRFLENNHTNTSFVWHIVGNGFLTRLSNVFTGFRLTDMMTCYKLVPTEFLKRLNLQEKRFGFEPEVTLKLSKLKEVKISEVAISYNARSKSEGKKINSKDGIRVILCILKYWFKK